MEISSFHSVGWKIPQFPQYQDPYKSSWDNEIQNYLLEYSYNLSLSHIAQHTQLGKSQAETCHSHYCTSNLK